tara:strand:+ start:4311 stop:4775 length:465 start_codon:yes stop_codon:yes gene_type:complete
MKVFKNLSEIGENVGKELGITEWQTITQEQINDFAEVTGDLQWIHTKPLKAKFGPFGTTIAHGFLVLSLAPRMLEDTYVVKSAKMGVNYGLNRVRFTAPVPVNSEIRGRVTLKSFEKMDNARGKGARLVVSLTFELKESKRPACVADLVFLIYE